MRIKKSCVLPLLMATLGLVPACQLSAQTFNTLYSFSDTSASSNSDGRLPRAGLILSGNTLYGTASYGGSSNDGTVFSINTDGTAFTNLYTFTGSEAANPWAGLILSGNSLYGTTANGGTWGNGTVFAVNTDGTGFTDLYSFSGSDGAHSQGGLILSGSTLYGTAATGGSSGNGTVFSIKTDGTDFMAIYSFSPTSDSLNSDGANPHAGLILWGNTLYGTTSYGGSAGNGTVFSLSIDGTGFTTLYSFTATNPDTGVNSDGASPYADLILWGDSLYGTTTSGGSSGNGTVFAVNTNGAGFTTLYSFSPRTNFANSDGAGPHAGLILWGDTLYGTALTGGSARNGTVFALSTNGTGFKTLHSFTAGNPVNGGNSDGANPDASLVLFGSTLYGTTTAGGTSGWGTLFSISLAVTPPQLAITPAAGNAILTWLTNLTGFTLQSTTNLASPVWTTNSQPPAVANGQYTVTNPISGAQQFYRLSQ